RAIRTLGLDADADPFSLAQTDDGPRELTELRLPDRLLYDQMSKERAFGRVEPHMGRRIELGGRPVTVAGLFKLGTDFSAEGNVLMDSRTFADHFRTQPGLGSPLGQVDIGALRLVAGRRTAAGAEAAAEKLRAALPEDVRVLTKPE